MQKPLAILLVIDTIDGALSGSFRDVIGIANRLAETFRLKVTVALPLPAGAAPAEIAPVALALSKASVSPVELIVLENPAFAQPHPALLADALERLIELVHPDLVALPHSLRHGQVAACLAMRSGAAAVTAVESFSADGGQLSFHRSLMNGKWRAAVTSQTPMAVLTVSQGAFARSAPEGAPRIPVSISRQAVPNSSEACVPLGVQQEPERHQDLEQAEVIVAAGRGVAGPEGLELVRRTARLFRSAAVGASRPLCDAGQMPHSAQVGETGRQVAPRLYLACGISGAPQHLAGIRGAQCLVAVNTDPEATIFQHADYGIVADATLLLPLLERKHPTSREDTPSGDDSRSHSPSPTGRGSG